MKPLFLALAALAFAANTGCVAPTGPVEVTRFHLPDTARLAQGSIAIAAAPGLDAESLEFRTYAAAVTRELQRIGYRPLAIGADAGTGGQVAVITIERGVLRPEQPRSPVSVGVGGGTGGVGLGIGVDLSGPPPEMVETRLSVTIRDRASGQALWEGRATFSARATSPLAQTQLGAARLAEALFGGFPGNSGETILVK
jgi:Domain of unknown function (DUF4136)